MKQALTWIKDFFGMCHHDWKLVDKARINLTFQGKPWDTEITTTLQCQHCHTYKHYSQRLGYYENSDAL